VDVERGNEPLSINVPLARRAIEPMQTVASACWDARTLQVAAPDAVFGLHDASPGRAGKKRKHERCPALISRLIPRRNAADADSELIKRSSKLNRVRRLRRRRS